MEHCTPDCYEARRAVPECECDFALRLSMGGLLRLVQGASTRHCTLLGITEERYRETHTAFLLAKLCAQVYRVIPAGAELTLSTRPAAPAKAVYHRYTTLTLEDGQPAAAVDARWVLVDTETKRILRRAPEALGLPFTNPSVPELPILIPKPGEEPLPLGEETVRYSRCDQNRHLNNTRYADLICDHLPLERLEAGPVRELTISYHREAPLGCTLGLYAWEEEPGRYYFLGKNGEQSCFEAAVKF